ncbi:MAG: hypothetical protein WBF90_32130 [Rivularia sp. (in: cyanobacteria)]
MIQQIETKICPKCDSSNLTEVIHPDQKHYGRLICHDCKNFIKWLPDPAITLLIDQRNRYIDGLLGYSGISSWERTFLRNIKESRWLSDRQQQKFDQICIRLVGKSYENTPNRGGRGERAIADSC